MFTNTMPRFIYAQLDPNEYNFRLWRASTQDIASRSLCNAALQIPNAPVTNYGRK